MEAHRLQGDHHHQELDAPGGQGQGEGRPQRAAVARRGQPAAATGDDRLQPRGPGSLRLSFPAAEGGLLLFTRRLLRPQKQGRRHPGAEEREQRQRRGAHPHRHLDEVRQQTQPAHQAGRVDQVVQADRADDGGEWQYQRPESKHS